MISQRIAYIGSIKTNSGAIALVVRFVWVSVNAAIRTMVRTKRTETAKKLGLGPLPNKLWCGSNDIWTQHGPKRTKNRK